MTDGILLNELQHDRMLRRYDTLIVDEAHERSLNIDFLLGYLKTLLHRRPDLKLIITSATIDLERFAEHFADAQGRPAPVVEVSGRTYPVEVRYRPCSNSRAGWMASPHPEARWTRRASRSSATRPRPSSRPSASLSAEGPGDVLVFLPGEREIRDTADALASCPRGRARRSRSSRSTRA